MAARSQAVGVSDRLRLGGRRDDPNQEGSVPCRRRRRLWSTAAANGISVFVAAGDSGAAGCDVHGSAAPATQSLNTNGFCTSQYDTCVGGTEFNDTANPSVYWSSTNTPTTNGSALSYIPEGSWNDPEGTVNGTTEYVVFAGGGGVSQFVSKPSWQTGPGVPADGFRDTPDVSFTASPIHDPYDYLDFAH